ncbi:MAG: preprotein translocase subunit YajC [Sphingobium sp.]|nr:preprotein translocase subunit YajC [Sphingobium sp.]MBP6110873.1 preprotein translocase subunit YajC [Sphingobium sp.]MBP8669983.1 preprotein translocase subunit YajC [Sphingobium sp.]MBP9157152.1 preprotein translocase subunit YajC [Sphingobium sp.]MCC6481101.1 preprotein translocase subunit YajC [Sphingomonadaceae bacterium]
MLLVSPAYAQTAGAAGASGSAAFMVQILPLLLIFVVFYFLILRPQSKRMKDHKAKIEAVKKGDQVVTGGGLIGKVAKVEEGVVEVELAQGVKVRALKSTLTDIIDPTAKPAND